MTTKDARWREFELLVARIEQALSGKNAIVRSPDRIKDKTTGILREVDASIRCTVGSSSLLITIECRDRSAIQDVTWIEQVASKKHGIGADKTIVVSSSGFTEPARQKAQDLGIEVRVTREIEKDDIAAWCDLKAIAFTSREYTIDNLQITVNREQESDSGGIDPSLFKKYRLDNLNSPIAFCKADRSPLTASMLMTYLFTSLAQNESQDSWIQAKPAEQTFRVSFPQCDYFTLTVDGERTVKEVLLHANFKYEERLVDPSTVPIVEYADRENALAHSMDIPLNLSAGRHSINLIHDPKTQLTQFSFSGPLVERKSQENDSSGEEPKP